MPPLPVTSTDPGMAGALAAARATGGFIKGVGSKLAGVGRMVSGGAAALGEAAGTAPKAPAITDEVAAVAANPLDAIIRKAMNRYAIPPTLIRDRNGRQYEVVGGRISYLDVDGANNSTEALDAGNPQGAMALATKEAQAAAPPAPDRPVPISGEVPLATDHAKSDPYVQRLADAAIVDSLKYIPFAGLGFGQLNDALKKQATTELQRTVTDGGGRGVAVRPDGEFLVTGAAGGIFTGRAINDPRLLTFLKDEQEKAKTMATTGPGSLDGPSAVFDAVTQEDALEKLGPAVKQIAQRNGVSELEVWNHPMMKLWGGRINTLPTREDLETKKIARADKDFDFTRKRIEAMDQEIVFRTQSGDYAGAQKALDARNAEASKITGTNAGPADYSTLEASKTTKNSLDTQRLGYLQLQSVLQPLKLEYNNLSNILAEPSRKTREKALKAKGLTEEQARTKMAQLVTDQQAKMDEHVRTAIFGQTAESTTDFSATPEMTNEQLLAAMEVKFGGP